MINDFCENIGVARKGNENYTSVKKLEFFARKELDANATRVFAVLEPLALNISNFAEIEKTEIRKVRKNRKIRRIRNIRKNK